MSKYGVFSGPYFPVFGLNTEIYGVNLRIHSEYRKIRTRKNSVFKYFYRSEEDRIRYKNQPNLCTKKTKKNYYRNLNEKNITDNTEVWKVVKYLLLNKSVSSEKIILAESQKILMTNNEIVKILNDLFSNTI